MDTLVVGRNLTSLYKSLRFAEVELGASNVAVQSSSSSSWSFFSSSPPGKVCTLCHSKLPEAEEEINQSNENQGIIVDRMCKTCFRRYQRDRLVTKLHAHLVNEHSDIMRVLATLRKIKQLVERNEMVDIEAELSVASDLQKECEKKVDKCAHYLRELEQFMNLDILTKTERKMLGNLHISFSGKLTQIRHELRGTSLGFAVRHRYAEPLFLKSLFLCTELRKNEAAWAILEEKQCSPQQLLPIFKSELLSLATQEQKIASEVYIQSLQAQIDQYRDPIFTVVDISKAFEGTILRLTQKILNQIQDEMESKSLEKSFPKTYAKLCHISHVLKIEQMDN